MHSNSNITAVLIGALLLHGFEPGPDLFTSDAPLVFAFIMTLYFSYLVMLLFGLIGPKYFSMVLKVRSNYIMSSFLVVCVIGAYAIRSNMTDVYLMLGLGLFGYLIQNMQLPLAPVVLGLILGPLAEKGLRHGLQLGGLKESMFSYFFLRPISMGIIALILIFLAFPYMQAWRQRKKLDRLAGDEKACGAQAAEEKPMRKPLDFVIAGLAIGLSLAGIFSLDLSADGEFKSVNIFPLFSFLAFIALGVMLILQNLLRKGWAKASEGGWCSLPMVPWRSFFNISLVYVVYVIALQWTGFIISSLVFIMYVTTVADFDKAASLRRKKMIRYAVFSVAATIGIYLLFIQLLNLSLPMAW